jgi:hypothetical protein
MPTITTPITSSDSTMLRQLLLSFAPASTRSWRGTQSCQYSDRTEETRKVPRSQTSAHLSLEEIHRHRKQEIHKLAKHNAGISATCNLGTKIDTRAIFVFQLIQFSCTRVEKLLSTKHFKPAENSQSQISARKGGGGGINVNQE